MKQTMSRALSLALVLAMLLSMAAPAFAQESGEGALPRSGAASAENATADSAPVEKPDSAPAEDAPGASAEDASDAPERDTAQEDAPSAPTSAANSTPAEDTPSAPDGETPDTPDPAQPLAGASDALPAPLAETDDEGGTWNEVFENGEVCFSWRMCTADTLEIKGTEMPDYSYPSKSFWLTATKLIVYPGVKSIGREVFLTLGRLETVELGEGLERIAVDAFKDCTSLRSVSLPSSLKELSGFRGCTSLSDITLPAGLQKIDEFAFTDCSSLPAVAIPAGVREISMRSFDGCAGLSSVTLPAGLQKIDELAFWGCTSLQEIVFPDGLKEIGPSAFQKTGLTRVAVPDSVTVLGGGIDESLGSASMCQGAFTNCAELTEVTLGRGITELLGGDFSGCKKLVRVEIPDTVTRIGSWAFENCQSLESVSIPAGVTSIGAGAFFGCAALEDVALPSGLTAIEGETFTDCGSLRSVNIPAGVTSIGNAAFSNCGSLHALTIPDSIVSIGDSAFSYTGLTQVTLGRGVTSIGSKAFQSCFYLTYAELPAALASVGHQAFNDCPSLKLVRFTGDAPEFVRDPDAENDFFAGVTAAVYYPANNATWTPEKRQQYQSSQSIYPKGVLTWVAGDGPACEPFAWSLSPEGLLTVSGTFMPEWGSWEHPFWLPQAEEIVRVEVADGVRNVGAYAFGDVMLSGPAGASVQYPNLKSVSLPSSVTQIGRNAFGVPCKALEEVVIREGTAGVPLPGSAAEVGDYAFAECRALKSVAIPQSATRIGEYAFQFCSKLTNVAFPEGLVSIGDNAFDSCSRLTDVAFPKGLTDIGTEAFYGCSGLTELTLPDGLTSISQAAFRDCSGLTNIVLPQALTSIGNLAFYGCSGLNIFLELPSGVTSIGNMAFRDCSGLTGIVIPEGLASIGDAAFSGCSALETIRFTGGAPEFITKDEPDQWAFSGLVATAYYPQDDATWTEDKRQDYGGRLTWFAYDPNGPILDAEGFAQGAEEGSDYWWKLDEAAGTLTVKGTKMPDWSTTDPAPWESKKLSIRSVMIERGMTNIGGSAFSNCISLTSAALPQGLTRIGSWAFYGCRSLRTVTLPEGLASIGDYAFYSCSSLTGALTLPKSLTGIGGHAFVRCSGLKQFVVADGNPKYCAVDGILYNKEKTTLLCAPGGISGAVVIPDGVTSIEDSAFAYCSGLTGSLTIPADVASIGADAFAFCTGLQKIRFAGDAPTFLGTGEILIFSGVTATVYYPQDNATWTADKRQNYGGTLTWEAYDPAHPPMEEVTPTPESPYQTETFGTGADSVDMLSHVAPGTTLAALKANLENGAALTIKSAKGETLTGDAPVGTGCTVGFGEDGETGKVVVMIDGDVDGNGKITMLDVVSMRQSILRIKSLRGAYLRAAMPVTQTGGGPKLNDVTRVRQYLLRIVSSVAK